ncbi:hypothetical protein F5Y17DRAFT_360911 [Xylariaceae sp. FL0594]|nr:hypothetical protein F5Y17DRAFT_360911 [Xylariaceae sp. FL0594]
MPHVGIAMERSLQHGSWKDAVVRLLARSASAALDKRQSTSDFPTQINDAATAFSSWDNCMKADFCKWPAIALIIVGGLIIFSIVWCIIRCCCCGLSCCCECCYCLKCCGECCGMCSPPRGRRNKYMDEPLAAPIHDQGYRPQAPMHAGGFGPAKPTVPQYAEFDAGNKQDADSLPAMPTWENANSKKVLVEEEAVEMEPLQKPQASQASQPSLLVNMPSRSQVASPRAMSPGGISPYGPPPGAGGPNGYMAAGHSHADSYGSSQQGYHGYDDYGYDHRDSPSNMNNMTGVATAGPLGRRPPPNRNHSGYDRGDMDYSYAQYPQSRSPRPYNDEYGRGSGTPTSYEDANTKYQGMPSSNDGYAQARRSPGPRAAYGIENPTRMRSPGAQAGYGYGNNSSRRKPVPQATGYSGGYSQPSRMRDKYDYPQQQQQPQPYQTGRGHEGHYQDDDAHHDAFPLPPTAAETYSPPPAPLSPIRNNSGFDFNSGYSRSNSVSNPRASPAPQALSPAPPPPPTGGSAYPGYRSYKPAEAPKPQQQQHDWDGL